MLDIWNNKIGEHTKEEFLRLLEQDDFYYGKEGSVALSASKLKSYYNSYYPQEVEFKQSEALIFGNWLHKIVLEPDTYSIEDAPEAHRGHLRHLRDEIYKDTTAKSILTHKSLRTEIPYVKKINGIWIKGKIDAELPGETWDLKSCSSLDSYEYLGNNRWMYPLSAWQYYILTGKIQHYIVVEKITGRVKIVRSTEAFYREGKRQWEWAWKQYGKSLQRIWTDLGHISLFNGCSSNFNEEVDRIPMRVKDNRLQAFILKPEYQVKRK